MRKLYMSPISKPALKGRELVYDILIKDPKSAKKAQIEDVVTQLKNAILKFKGVKTSYSLVNETRDDVFKQSLVQSSRSIVYDFSAQTYSARKAEKVCSWLLTKCNFETGDLTRLEKVIQKVEQARFLSSEAKKAKQKKAKELKEKEDCSPKVSSGLKKKHLAKPKSLPSTPANTIKQEGLNVADVILMPPSLMPKSPPRPSLSFGTVSPVDDNSCDPNDATSSDIEQLKDSDEALSCGTVFKTASNEQENVLNDETSSVLDANRAKVAGETSIDSLQNGMDEVDNSHIDKTNKAENKELAADKKSKFRRILDAFINFFRKYFPFLFKNTK